ncbi:MAG: spoVB [Haloplasmataceae bacterium]|jgi:stage V sporulation protein B|nr:spoVB [Haloplasmataceae bacterium]
MTENKFVKNSVLLIFSNLMINILSFIFTVILSRQMGPEGMGLYGLVFPVSSLLMSIISGGLMTAVSKVIAEYHTRLDYNNIKKCIKSTLIFNLLTSLVIISIALILSFRISVVVINDARTVYALRFLLISIIFMAITNTYKGYFYGTANVVIPALVDVAEKVMRIVLILILFKVLRFDDITDSITIAFLILCVGELLSLVFFYAFYKIDIKKYDDCGKKSTDSLQLLYNVFSLSIPLMITELISSSLYTISTLIVPRRLLIAGFSYNNSLALIGKFGGMAMNIVFFPSFIIYSISTLLIPDLSSSISKKDYDTVEKRVISVINISMFLGLTVLITCLFYGDELGMLVFKRNDLGDYIKFIALCSPILFTANTTRGILNGIGKQGLILRNSSIASIMQVLSLYFLISIPSINIYGFGITMLLTSGVTIFLNMREVNKIINLKLINFLIYTTFIFQIIYVLKMFVF